MNKTYGHCPTLPKVGYGTSFEKLHLSQIINLKDKDPDWLPHGKTAELFAKIGRILKNQVKISRKFLIYLFLHAQPLK